METRDSVGLRRSGTERGQISALPFSAMASSSTSTPTVDDGTKPSVIITIGMAGAGKSTFVQRLNSHLHAQTPPSPPYILNLDPAITHSPFDANIDIRDTIDYKEVMKQCVSKHIL
jgi:GPN-loop GTPase